MIDFDPSGGTADGAQAWMIEKAQASGVAFDERTSTVSFMPSHWGRCTNRERSFTA